VQRIAVVGLGAMGRPIAARLMGGGYRVGVWNRSPPPAEALARAGAAVFSSPADAARWAEAVLVMVSDPAALRAVTGGGSGIAAAAGGRVVIQMSTVAPADLIRLRDILPADAELLDAPVLGSVSEAESGSLRVLAGGSRALVERCAPLLMRLGSVSHLGDVGSGTAAKLVANNALFGVLGVLGESLALSAALGLSPLSTFDVLAATPLAAQAYRRRGAIETDAYPARFALSLARKDADLIAGCARDLGLGLGVSAATREWLVGAEADGRAAQDYTAVLAHIRAHAAKGPPR
jgi:3-hydroxyisobutyrate dehydrogenase